MAALFDILSEQRTRRGFDVAHALARKSALINAYFADSDLTAAVVGVSGGVDSAVVLQLLAHAGRQPDSPLRRVVGVLAPIHSRGATHQDRALLRGQQVVAAAGAEPWVCDLSAAQAAYVSAFAHPAAAGDASTAWAEGQLLSVVRTPALYYAAALLQAQGERSLVVGTTNRDEGAYLGFFGKASDGMVDLQPISDLHKHEVVLLARRLGVPADVIAAPPAGDVYDGRTDAELIGAPYWAVELHALLLAAGHPVDLDAALDDADERTQWRTFTAAIEDHHRRNAHKYRVGSPAVHLDVYPRAVPGGWGTC